ncbi:MAG: NUDIX hydrolase [Dehalococcoidia bacterium]
MRVAAVAVHEGRVLLHRTAGGSIWSLPGGRVRVGERIEDAVRRELREEAGMKAQPGEVLWVDENFFEMPSAQDGPGRGEVLRHHELGVYVAVAAPERFTRRDTFRGRELAGTEHEFALEFRWVAPADLNALDVRPARIVSALRAQMAGR